MTEQPPDPQSSSSTPPPPPPPPPPPYGGAQAGYQQAGYQQPGYPQPGYPPGGYGVGPATPYGVHPGTGIPYSDKSKLVAGLLQILIPLGIGRFYIGDNKTGVLQLVVTILTCGIGALWPIIDGILMLVNDSKDVNGYMLRS